MIRRARAGVGASLGTVASCCNPRGCDQFFDAGFASRAARRYREGGLDRNARRLVGFLTERGIEGATVLEIGGGVGEIQIELLEQGAARCVSLELSSAYEEEARTLLRERGLEGRVDRRVCDIAVDPAVVAPADAVVLHRVVCCYPDYEPLLAAVAGHARRLVVFSYPPRNVVSRLFVAGANLFFRLRRKDFRTFVHPPAALVRTLEDRGFRRTFARRGLVWHVAGFER
jgi:magnesium-protoporphyrin O-methyltransferase